MPKYKRIYTQKKHKNKVTIKYTYIYINIMWLTLYGWHIYALECFFSCKSSEDNKEIIEPEEAKEYIAGYIENLY